VGYILRHSVEVSDDAQTLNEVRDAIIQLKIMAQLVGMEFLQNYLELVAVALHHLFYLLCQTKAKTQEPIVQVID